MWNAGLVSNVSPHTKPPKKRVPAFPAVREEKGGFYKSLNRTVETCGNFQRQSNQTFFHNRTSPDRRKNFRFCNFSHVKREQPICRYYKLGICFGGESGTENGFVCKFAHPKLCKNFCEHGHDRKLGCTKSRKCNYYHPKICREAWNFGKCFKTNCSLRHLKSTNRKIDPIVKPVRVLMAKQVNSSAQEHTNKKPEPAQIDVTNEKDVDKATETNYQASVNSSVKPDGTENPEDAKKTEQYQPISRQISIATSRSSREKSNFN